MSLEFKLIEISDKQWVQELVGKSNFRGCEYSFGTSYMWSSIFDIQIAKYKNFYLSKTKDGFWFPAGDGNLREVISVLKDYATEIKRPLIFTNADKASTEILQELYGEQLEITTNRDYYDYVYDYESLSTLKGRKLHGKRNHLNRFYENRWSFEPITPENIEEVAAMHNKWCDEKSVYDDPEKLREAGAVIRGLDAFFELGFVGGIIRVENAEGEMEIQAYSFGSEINNRDKDTFIVHVEKAFATTQGVYAAINKEFINYAGAGKGYSYVNREEDMGAENLRKAKMSYRPAFLLEKYRVLFK
ncbi:MAG: phosphatidylglycerol lysyltransferase domain-containing protein [Oscillospiraceae bacterium]|nr:phosphatidylglycerol lysyltransferase domain-containing protein [Oscillospiraceae bacterium]